MAIPFRSNTALQVVLTLFLLSHLGATNCHPLPPDVTAPVLSDIQATAGTDSATVTWTTDERAYSSVAYGPTAAYENGSVGEVILVTDHVILLQGLLPGTTYHYQVTSVDDRGNVANSGDLSFTTVAAPSGILSDAFNHICSALEDDWSFVDPLGDGGISFTGAGTEDAHLLISVSGGASHDIWDQGNFAPRIMRSANDTDFEIEVKFESDLLQKWQGQGLIVEESPDNYLRFDFFTNGSSVRIFAASFLNDNPSVRLNQAIIPGNPLYMTIQRVGNQWTQLYSYDGQAWITAVAFSHSLVVSSVGVFALNAGTAPTNAPAHTAIVDFFFNTAVPIVPEDGTTTGDPGPKVLTVNVDGAGSAFPVPDQPSYDCGEAIEITAAPDQGHEFTGWSGDASGTANPLTMVMSKDRQITASFILDASPPILSDIQVSAGTNSATVTWTTNEPATSSVAYGPTAAYEYGSVDDPAMVTDHAILLQGLLPETTYHYQVTSVDGVDLPASSGDLVFTTAGTTGPVIDVWYGTNQSFGQIGIPQPRINLLGNVTDPGGVDSLTYSVNGGPDISLNMGPDGRRLEAEGDFNADIELGDLDLGSNFVTITATDSSDNTSFEIVTVFADDRNIWPLGYTANWNASRIEDVAQITDGLWEFSGDAIHPYTIHPVELGFDRLVAIGDLFWEDYEVTVPIKITGVDHANATSTPAVGLVLRWAGHYGAGQPQPEVEFNLGAIASYRISDTPPPQTLEMWTWETKHSPSLDFTLDLNVWYTWKMRVESDPGGPIYSVKIWQEGSTEPGDWVLSEQQTPTDLRFGSMLLLAHFADAHFGTVEITPLP